MATISDVARLAGLSVSTVSRVINDSPHVSPKKRKLVKEAMNQLGYVPLPAARQLRGSSSKSLAVVVPRIVNPFFSHLIDAIERTLVSAEFNTIIVQTYGSKKQELNALELLKMQQVDGVILCSLENEWSVISEYLKFGKIVLANEYLKDLPIPMIYADQYQGLKSGTEYLIKQGFKNIAYATGRKTLSIAPLGSDFDSDRFHGFQDALQDADMSYNSNLIFYNAHTEEDGNNILDSILQLEDKPDAIIAGSDEVAAGIVEEARSRGVLVPSQLGILGIDDQPMSSKLNIPLSTIRQPVDEMGIKAAQVMISELDGNKERNIELLKLEVIPRQSA
ncbi:LacI family DNA-binding transcriptional regulator [Companilactobacillus allii]|uniref:Transcriptional regulator n=1 Tax=Companilactobacillus allii TaxID=1847728 RepID=A0A1P8Q0I8_9LACO|nr:LacI family DNA-binding transcriptional regulator [Companilactobacillus allii]APX71337.1 transcriptional regulator [Companilactobacillus allii]USQ68418.1 LacI family DNA-binding transcriptional regulator [Companilactobacillus allii]